MTNPRRITKAVIPAAGKGTRLLPLTRAVPKELIPLGRKPVLEHVVDECAACGIQEILFVISKDKEAIRTHFGESDGRIRFSYAYQPQQNGIADAVFRGREFAGGEAFAVVLGDSVIETDQDVGPFRRVLDTFETTGAGAVIAVQRAPRAEISRYGIVKPKCGVGPVFEIDGVVEKPAPQDAPSDYAVAGRYAFEPAVFDYIRRTPRGAGGEYQITDSIRLMLADGRAVWCVALSENETRRDIGEFETYFEAFESEVENERRRAGFRVPET